MTLNKELATQGFQIRDGIVIACNGLGLKNMLRAGKQWLEAHVHVINNLNVFPVPDGDTGTNMLLTMRSALEKAEAAPNHDVGTIAAAAAQGALMGARGNSGVILSQFLQGLATSLAGRTTFVAGDFAQAARQGAEQAYRSVINPVEGTILTVARAVSEAAQQSSLSNRDLVVLFTDILKAARIAQANTPELLPVLKEAGVTDSGGQGLVYILEGGLRFINGESVDVDGTGNELPVLPLMPGIKVEESYGFDVQFLIQGERLNVEEIRAYVDKVGWSTVVVGDERTVKVHLHTPDPDVPLGFGASQGVISDVVIENLDEQAKRFLRERTEAALPATVSPSLPSSRYAGAKGETTGAIATIAVAPGEGLARIFQSLGVSRVLSGGQAQNPSIQELLEAIDQAEFDTVLVLPNNSNVMLAAQQAEALSHKTVRVVPTATIPQGIAALLSFNYQAGLEANARRMLEAARQVQTLELARAVRESICNGFNIKAGDVIGLFDNELVSVGPDYWGVVLDILAKIDVGQYEVATLYFGQGSSLDQADALAGRIFELYPDIEIEVHDGGQPHYQYIISLE